jgi:hypothetical protein
VLLPLLQLLIAMALLLLQAMSMILQLIMTSFIHGRSEVALGLLSHTPGSF